MKEMRRIIALVLTLVMVVGMVPVSAFAAENTTEYLFLATDRHANTSVIGNIINNMESTIGENELDYLGLGGDMVGSGNSHPAYNSSTVLGEVTGATNSLSAANVDIVAGIHDMNVTDDAGIVLPYQDGGAQIYEGDKFYVYGVEEYCISEDSDENNWSNEAQAFVDWANGDDIDKSKVIVVLSHYPLHAKRDDNDGAYYWHQALNTVATGGDNTVERDVFFFHGHNHTKDSNEYVYNVGDTMSIQNGSSTTSDTIYYTYATAGYLNQNSKATLMAITDDAVTLTKYSTSGSGSAMTTVERVVTESEAALESISISGETSYYVGDELDLTVTATYSDGTTADVTAQASFDNDLSASGVYTVTATYTEDEVTKTASIENVKVYLYDEDDYNQMAVEVLSQGATALKVTWDDTAEAHVVGVLDDYVVYDLALTGHTAGTNTEYAMLLVEDMASGVVLYHVADDGTLTEIAYTVENDCLVFNTTLTGTFAYGTAAVPAGYVLDSLAVKNAPTEFFVGDSLLTTGDFTVTATYTKDGAEDFTRTLYVYEENNNPDGYLVNMDSFDMTTAGKYDVELTYGGKSVTFPINVWGHDFTASDVTVYVDGAEYGVTSAVVTESTNEHVSTAIAGVIQGENYKAYDISLTYSEGYQETDDVKTVTLPIPEGVSNPVVYYVSDDGATVTNMKATKGDGVVTFTTDHFSIYVVGETAEEAEKDLTLGGTTTETKTKTVYVLSSGNPSGNVLIANSATAGSVNLVANDGGDLSNTTATVVYGDCDGDGDSEYYIELTDATNELWTVSNSYRFANQDEYLRCSNGNLSVSSQSTTWSYSNNRLSYEGRNSTYYLRYNNDWTVTTSSGSASSIYFYVPTEVEYEVEVDTSTTYTVSAEDIVHVYDSDDTTDETEALTYALLANGEEVSFDGQVWTVAVVSDPNGIIDTSNSTNETLYFTGAEGEATVRVYYQLDANGDGDVTDEDDYKVWTTINVTASNPYYSLDLHKANVTYNEATGLTAFVEGTTYFTKNEDGTYTKVASDATFDSSVTYYTLSYTLGDEITDTVAIKGIEAGDKYGVWAVVKYYDGDPAEGEDMGAVGDAIEWSSSDTSIATVDPVTGVITFTGKEGTVNITATYKNGNQPSDTITISVTKSQYNVPADGTDDFPEYPNEGAVRFDKTATAVGNFSETGIAQIELSMTGVPYTTGSEIDVVVMLDMTGSMSDNGMSAAEEATVAFVEKIVKNEDGSYNNNRVAVYAFNSGSSSPYELVSLKAITSDDELTTANAAIRTASSKQASGGTPFDEATQKCYNVLQAAKTDGTGNNRQQFCVFMSDGGPTSYAGDDGDGTYTTITNSGSGTTAITTYFSGYSSSSSSSWNFTLPSEYYTNLMKADGVTVYTVGLLLQNKPSNPSPYSSMTSSTYNSTTDSLTSIGSHYYFTSRVLKQMASDESKYIDIFNVDNASKATAAFTSIAKSILQAATDVTVEDKITDEYTMIFDIPEGTKDITGVTNDFYIEFVKYDLIPVYKQVSITSFASGVKYYTKSGDTYTQATSYVAGTTYYIVSDYERSGSTSVTKLYLKNTNDVYSAADASGNAYAAPVFENKIIGDKGTLYYWTTDSSYASKAAVSYTSNGTTYYFYPYGIKATDDGYDATKWFNMTSGGYASGTVDSTTNMSENVVIATPYFVYNAATKKLYWTVDKIDTTEYALRYFLYLDNSATEVSTDKEVDAGTYPTNEYAFITYTNYKGNDCRVEFPEPQLTWSGAQVSYVFYLVNAAGQPINKAGQVVDFSNASFITDIYTKSVVWNKGTDGTIEGDANLSVDWLAEELLPEGYLLYDLNAGYELKVYADATGTAIFNYFTIEGDTAANISASLNDRLTNANTTDATVSVETTKVYNTKAGTKYDDYGTYTSKATDSINDETILTSFDFSNSTVAFAVVWQPALAPDTIVVDYGLDVLINVLENDLMQYSKVNGIGLSDEAYGNVAMNSGVSSSSVLGKASLTVTGNNTISIENDRQIRFNQNDMTFEEPVTFYYESEAEYYENSEKKTGYMYSSVTVIPATTIYYEDEYVTLKTFTDPVTVENEDGTETTTYTENKGWDTKSVAATATQAQDRPGTTLITGVVDANNAYGYDAAYNDMSQYSMGNAAMVNVTTGKYATAEFEFYGTGFDVISMTDKSTGTIFIDVYNAAGTKVVSESVNTYYGYKFADGKWVVTENANDPNALYQVPVIKIGDGVTTDKLTYGKYKVVITASYVAFLDSNKTDTGYNFYLDAVRVYNPAGDTLAEMGETVSNAYSADGELLPSYKELRDIIISAGDFDKLTTDSVEGIVFIDGNAALKTVSDYTNYGPNNELYLTNGQAVSFDLAASAIGTVPDGCKLASVQIAMKAMDDDGAVAKLYNVASDGTATNTIEKTLTTSTDLYYDITKLNNGTVVITNTGSGVLSITNVKITYELVENAAAAASEEDGGIAVASFEDQESGIAVASLEETEAVATASVFSVSRASTNAALLSLAPVAEEEEPEATEPTEPEATEPSEPEETDPSEPETEPSEPETEPSEPEEEQKPTKPGKPNKPGNKPGNGNNKPGNGNKNPIWDRFKETVEFIFGWLLH